MKSNNNYKWDLINLIWNSLSSTQSQKVAKNLKEMPLKINWERKVSLSTYLHLSDWKIYILTLRIQGSLNF